MSVSIFYAILVTSLATFLSRFLGVLSSVFGFAQEDDAANRATSRWRPVKQCLCDGRTAHHSPPHGP